MTDRARTVSRPLAPIAALGLAFVLVGCGGGESGGSSASKPVVTGPDGRKLFQTNCATCHGDTGHGDGIAAAALAVKPRNLTTEPYKYVDIAAASGSEIDALSAYIKVGRVENGMPPFGHMKEEEIKAMAKFVSGLRPKPNFVEEKPAAGGEQPAPAGGEAGGAAGGGG
ncbi:MAG: cytochrome c [Phycisphaerales bacterium]|nr:cytochrome c [Phycisphaerales bacterium]